MFGGPASCSSVQYAVSFELAGIISDLHLCVLRPSLTPSSPPPSPAIPQYDKLIARERTSQEHYKEQALRYAEMLLRKQYYTSETTGRDYHSVVKDDVRESNKRISTNLLTWSFDNN